MSIPSIVWKKLKDLYEPSNLSTKFDYLSIIWNISLSDYSSITAYCSALEVAASNYLASGPMDFTHMLTLIALMRLPSSYKVMQHNILSRAGSSTLLLDAIKGDLLNKERMLARETKHAEKVMNALQAQRYERGNCRGKPRTPEEKAHYAEWVKKAICQHCKEVGHIKATCPKKTHANQVTSMDKNPGDRIESEDELEVEAMLAHASLEGV